MKNQLILQNDPITYSPTSRWTPLRKHFVQHQLWQSKQRFIVNPAGRRSGKTELAKRKLVKRAMNYFLDKSFPVVKFEDPRFFAAAPTRDQAKRIYWDDLKRLTPRWAQKKPPNESEMAIHFTNGATLYVVGMDKPERIEGSPWDGGILDEFGNMKKQSWGEHVRPALADRTGWCDLIGVPEGRNHYYDIAKEAQANESGEWAYFHWFSSDILPQSEIDAARADLDELVYQQEYEGCHDPNTLIRLWNGDVKKICELVIGDILVSWQDGTLIPSVVLNVGKTGIKGMLLVELEDGTSFYASRNHKMRIRGEIEKLQDCSFLEKVPLYFHPLTKMQALAAIVGFNLGDGFICQDKKTGYLSGGFFSNEKEALLDLKKDFDLAGLVNNVSVRKKGGGWSLQINNKNDMTARLVEAGCVIGHKPSQDFGVPSWIKESDKDVQRCFLAALWGAEGLTPIPVDDGSGKHPKACDIKMNSKRLVKECGQMIFDSFGINSTYVEKPDCATLYMRKGFLEKIGYLYSPKKQQLAWLWKHYSQSALQLRREIVAMRNQGLIWKDIGNAVGLKMGTARQIGLSNSTRVSNFFEPFDVWVNDHFENGRLRLKIADKELKEEKQCWNVLVDSLDHSYILDSEIDNFNSFVNFTGRTYYPFLDSTHCARVAYDKKQPLIICLDFNVAPGVAVVLQEKPIKDITTNAYLIGETATGVLGEVYIPRNSNTPIVCNRLIKDWGDHQGRVVLYGDATGGSKGTAKLGGSDWDLVKQYLGKHFGDRLIFNVARSNPSERDRVNSVNSRLRTMDGKIRLYVDPNKAPHVVKDFEGVQCVEGGSGEIDKSKTPELTHLSDAIGYYIHQEFPVRKIGAGMAIVRGV